ncbi:MAG: Mut7-C RNAse domain-containing protein [Candidatus Hodarchaeales archaeon]|jgi:uncharacterized protein with PIN domain
MKKNQSNDYKELRFLVDAMLVKLGKFMRIFGLDTKFADNSIPDDMVMNRALKTDRILITMDKSLYARMLKQTKKVIFINTKSLDTQLVRIFTKSRIKFPSKDIDNPLSYNSRCSRCNTILHAIPKKNIKEKIPEQSYAAFDHFWICPNEECEKIYWRGSHWERIRERFKVVRDELNRGKKK